MLCLNCMHSQFFDMIYLLYIKHLYIFYKCISSIINIYELDKNHRIIINDVYKLCISCKNRLNIT